MVLDKLNPKEVFHYFEEICAIPHGSGNEKAISDYLKAFAEARGLTVVQDSAMNIYIQKPGTPGYETAPGVALQGHMDMVCDKEKDADHDFLADPLKLYIDGDYVRAKGTTLGADNGIAVAMALAILDSKDIPHPPLEAVITSDEEVGMSGAMAFDGALIKGKYLVNLDSDGDDTLLVSCCGGLRADVSLPVNKVTAPAEMTPMLVSIKGLKGGHSGVDIHTQKANANMLLGRVLLAMQGKLSYCLSRIHGGSADNVICREAEANVWVKKEELAKLETILADMELTFTQEFKGVEDGICVSAAPAPEADTMVFCKGVRDNIIQILTLLPYGVATMSLTMAGLVESSANPGVIRTEGDHVRFAISVRSSNPARKQVLLQKIEAVAALTGAEVTTHGDYPGWEFDPESKLLAVCKQTYQNCFGEEPKVVAIHAGVECGIFGAKTKLDMISFGPNMHDIHSPAERLSISSTEKCWNYLQAVLKNLK